MNFGKKMKRSRVDIGTTLGEMAKETGLSAGYISSLENQRKRIKQSDIEKINQFFTKRGLVVDWQSLADKANSKPLEKLEIDLSRCFVNWIDDGGLNGRD